MISTHPNELASILTTQFGQAFHIEPSTFGFDVRTPFLYPDNSPVVVSIEHTGGDVWRVSDHGQASEFAFLSGISDLAANSRAELSARRFRLDRHNDAVSCNVHLSDLADGILRVSMFILDVAYLIYRRVQSSSKKELQIEVQSFLLEHNRRFRRDIELQGQSRNRKVDFQVDITRHEQLNFWLLDASTTQGATQQADHIAFSFVDIQRAGLIPASKFAALIRTPDGLAPEEEIVRTLTTYLPRVVQWEDIPARTALLAADAA